MRNFKKRKQGLSFLPCWRCGLGWKTQIDPLKVQPDRTSKVGGPDLCNTDRRVANRLNSDAKRIANGSLLDQNGALSDHFEAGFERFGAQKVAQRVVIDSV